MIYGERVSISGDSAPHVVVTIPDVSDGAAIFDVLIRVSGSNPVDFGTSAVTSGEGFSLSDTDAPVRLQMSQNDVLYGSASSSATVEVLVTNQHY